MCKSLLDVSMIRVTPEFNLRLKLHYYVYDIYPGIFFAHKVQIEVNGYTRFDQQC